MIMNGIYIPYLLLLDLHGTLTRMVYFESCVIVGDRDLVGAGGRKLFQDFAEGVK